MAKVMSTAADGGGMSTAARSSKLGKGMRERHELTMGNFKMGRREGEEKDWEASAYDMVVRG